LSPPSPLMFCPLSCAKPCVGCTTTIATAKKSGRATRRQAVMLRCQRRHSRCCFDTQADCMDRRIETSEFAYIRQTTRGPVWKLPGESTKDPGAPSGTTSVVTVRAGARHNLAVRRSVGSMATRLVCRRSPGPGPAPAVGSRLVGTLFPAICGQRRSVSSRTHGIPLRPTVFRR